MPYEVPPSLNQHQDTWAAPGLEEVEGQKMDPREARHLCVLEHVRKRIHLSPEKQRVVIRT